MKRLTDENPPAQTASNPEHDRSHDYGQALQSAVSWLGDRYLLAEPVQRRKEPHKAYFVEPRSWHPPARPSTRH
jgi:hypothetical protein